jgi:hypothetical protein
MDHVCMVCGPVQPLLRRLPFALHPRVERGVAPTQQRGDLVGLVDLVTHVARSGIVSTSSAA